MWVIQHLSTTNRALIPYSNLENESGQPKQGRENVNHKETQRKFNT